MFEAHQLEATAARDRRDKEDIANLRREVLWEAAVGVGREGGRESRAAILAFLAAVVVSGGTEEQ